MKILFLMLGFLSLGFGTAGIFVPVLPSFPFLLLAAFCFARSSARISRWFLSTGIYKKHLAEFVKNRTMSVKARVSVMVSITLLLTIAFVLIGDIPAVRVILLIVWLFHAVYFIFRVKTCRPQRAEEGTDL